MALNGRAKSEVFVLAVAQRAVGVAQRPQEGLPVDHETPRPGSAASHSPMGAAVAVAVAVVVAIA
jgi:hypothetical protein